MKSFNILIVDDDPDDQRLFMDAVKDVDEDMQCIAAIDGLAALELLQNRNLTLPDIIFLDLRMPRFSGRKCLLEIKKDERLKNIPVVIYTTSREVEESRELKELGAIHYISKPSNPEEIYYVVALVLEEHMNTLRNKAIEKNNH